MVYKERKEVNNTRKNQAIGALIAKYTPKAASILDLLSTDETATSVNIEVLAEQAMAIVGNMQCVNAFGYDFIRIINGVVYYPDSKTASVSSDPRASGNYVGCIRNVTRENGHEKAGDLLAIVYIPYNDSVKFFYIPKAWWVDNVTMHGKLNFMYNPKTDSIEKFEDFECKTFEDLCSPDRVGEWEQLVADRRAAYIAWLAANKLEAARRWEESAKLRTLKAA